MSICNCHRGDQRMDCHHGDLHKHSAYNDFHVRSDVEEIWEGRCTNGAVWLE